MVVFPPASGVVGNEDVGTGFLHLAGEWCTFGRVDAARNPFLGVVETLGHFEMPLADDGDRCQPGHTSIEERAVCDMCLEISNVCGVTLRVDPTIPADSYGRECGTDVACLLGQCLLTVGGILTVDDEWIERTRAESFASSTTRQWPRTRSST